MASTNILASLYPTWRILVWIEFSIIHCSYFWATGLSCKFSKYIFTKFYLMFWERYQIRSFQLRGTIFMLNLKLNDLKLFCPIWVFRQFQNKNVSNVRWVYFFKHEQNVLLTRKNIQEKKKWNGRCKMFKWTAKVHFEVHR